MTTIRVTTDIELDIETAAKWFAALNDDDMAKFFCAVAEKVKGWPHPAMSPQMMWAYVGEHLATCECSTEDGRNMLRDIVHFMEQRINPPTPAKENDDG